MYRYRYILTNRLYSNTKIFRKLATKLNSIKLSLLILLLGTNIEGLESAFTEAKDICDENSENPGAIILLKNVDAAAGGRKGIHQLQGVARIQRYLDEIDPRDDNVMIVGTTSQPASVSHNLRRPGRFGLEVFIKVG